MRMPACVWCMRPEVHAQLCVSIACTHQGVLAHSRTCTRPITKVNEYASNRQNDNGTVTVRASLHVFGRIQLCSVRRLARSRNAQSERGMWTLIRCICMIVLLNRHPWREVAKPLFAPLCFIFTASQRLQLHRQPVRLPGRTYRRRPTILGHS